MDCVYLKDAKYLNDYKIFLTFNDGKSGEVDLKEMVHRYKVALPLRDPQRFAEFYLDSWPTIAWDCGFDVAPESLYEICEHKPESDA